MFRRTRMFSAVAAAGLLLTACATAEDDPDGATDQSEEGAGDGEQGTSADGGDDAVDEGADGDASEGTAGDTEGQTLGLQQGPTDQSVEEVAELLSQHDLFHSRINLAEVLDAPIEAQVVMFREPEAEAELITQNPQLGLEAPFKLLVWDDDGQTRVAVNDPESLADRYGLSIEDLPAVQTLDAELQRSMLMAVGAEVEEPAEEEGSLGFSMTELATTSDDFATTLRRVRSAIEEEGLRVLTEIDHTSNLSDEGVEIDEMTLVVFTNPETSSQLLELRPTIGIDLPPRVLVYEDEEEGSPVTRVAFHHPLFYESRHQLDGVEGAQGPLEELDASLTAIADAVEAGEAEAGDSGTSDDADSDDAGDDAGTNDADDADASEDDDTEDDDES